MNQPTAFRRLAAICLAILVAALGAAPRGAARCPGASIAFQQWDLDIEKAMDAIGVAPGMVIGEAGAGSGYFTIPMARRVGASGVVYANDIDHRALASLERQAKTDGLANVHTVVGEIDDPRFPRTDLQLVVLVHAFHDFAKPVDWLRNAKKYLAPGATVAIVDRDPVPTGQHHFWPRDRITGYGRDAGYDVVKAVDASVNHLIVVLKPR